MTRALQLLHQLAVLSARNTVRRRRDTGFQSPSNPAHGAETHSLLVQRQTSSRSANVQAGVSWAVGAA